MPDDTEPEAQEYEDLVEELFAPRTRGNVRRALSAEYTRDLSAADIAALELPRGTLPRSVATLRSRHHALAKCIASGLSNNHSAIVTGYDPSRVSALLMDPAFTALVEDYRAAGGDVFADQTSVMKNCSMDAVLLIQERLENAPDDFTTAMLLDVATKFADRTGHGPNSEVTLNLRPVAPVDRPAKETREEWEARRARELEEERLLLSPAPGRPN